MFAAWLKCERVRGKYFGLVDTQWTLGSRKTGVGREMVDAALEKKKMETTELLKFDTRLRTIVDTVNK